MRRKIRRRTIPSWSLRAWKSHAMNIPARSTGKLAFHAFVVLLLIVLTGCNRFDDAIDEGRLAALESLYKRDAAKIFAGEPPSRGDCLRSPETGFDMDILAGALSGGKGCVPGVEAIRAFCGNPYSHIGAQLSYMVQFKRNTPNDAGFIPTPPAGGMLDWQTRELRILTERAKRLDSMGYRCPQVRRRSA